MTRPSRLRMVPLRLPQNGLRAFEERLIARKLDFLLWGWNYICANMVREWLEPQGPPTRGLRPHVDRWTVQDWAQALGRCAGMPGHLLFDSESIKVTKQEEAQFVELFKTGRSTKNGYSTRDYKDRFRRTLSAALMQLLQPHRACYITLWQVSFVECVIEGTPIHWASILHRVMRQHAFEEKGGTLNHLSPFLINFYRQRNCLTAAELEHFPPLSIDHPGKYVRENEVDTDAEESPTSTPSRRRDEGRHTPAARVPRKRRWREESEEEQHQESSAPIRPRPLCEPYSRPKQKARRLVLPADSADSAD